MEVDHERVVHEDEVMEFEEEEVIHAGGGGGDEDEVMDADDGVEDDEGMEDEEMEPEPVVHVETVEIHAELPSAPATPGDTVQVEVEPSTTRVESLSAAPPLASGVDDAFELPATTGADMDQGSEPAHNHPDSGIKHQPEVVPESEIPHDMVASTSRSPQYHISPTHSPAAADEEDEYDQAEDDDDYPYPTDIHTLPAITLHLPDGDRSLFYAGESKSLAWLQGKEMDFIEASLADVWAAIRAEMAREGLIKSGELVIAEKQMDLKMGEDDLNLQSITLLELAQLHHGCGLSPPLELFVSFEPGRFYQRFTAIQKEVSAQAKESDESVDGKSEPDANGPIPRSVPQSTVKAEGRETLVDQSKRGNPAEFRQARPAQAEYGGSQIVGHDDEHPHAVWANSKPILPMHVSNSRRIIADRVASDDGDVKGGDDEGRVGGEYDQDGDEDHNERDTESDSEEYQQAMSIAHEAPADQLLHQGALDVHAMPVHPVDEISEVDDPDDEHPLDELDLMKARGEVRTSAEDSLSPIVSVDKDGAITPIATSELFTSDRAAVPTPLAQSTVVDDPLETEYPVAPTPLEQVDEITEDIDSSVPATASSALDDALAAKEVAQQELDDANDALAEAEAEVAQQKENLGVKAVDDEGVDVGDEREILEPVERADIDDDDDDDDDEEDGFEDEGIDVSDPMVIPKDTSVNVLDSQPVALAPDESVPYESANGSPLATEYQEDEYDTDEDDVDDEDDGIDGITNNLVKKSDEPTPLPSASTTLDGDSPAGSALEDHRDLDDPSLVTAEEDDLEEDVDPNAFRPVLDDASSGTKRAYEEAMVDRFNKKFRGSDDSSV